MPEGEEKKQEIGNLSEKLIKENFSNLVKEIDMQGQEAQSPKQDGCKEAHPGRVIIKMPKVKDQENIKSSKKKAVSYLQGSSHKTVS